MAIEDDVQEVDFTEAATEAHQNEGGEDIPVAPVRPRPGAGSPQSAPESPEAAQADQAREDFDILAPKAPRREWTFGKGDEARSYIQQELSVIGFAQWTALVGEFMDQAMSGNNALSLNSLLSPPTPRTPGQFSIQDFQDADVFVHALGKLVQFSPDFMAKSVCIWLDVPDYEWDLVTMLMKRSPRDGGMGGDMFQDIVETFIDQNYSEINAFFRKRFQNVLSRYRSRAKEAENQSRSPRR